MRTHVMIVYGERRSGERPEEARVFPEARVEWTSRAQSAYKCNRKYETGCALILYLMQGHLLRQRAA